ncbi:MAG: arginase family protein, partial [Gammaproteobacteria bacterium]|nr:arginase family protein [Gammaproteobacteria bacterium]
MFRQGVFEKNNIALIGVPSSAGARQVGQEQAPQCLRAAGLVQRLISRGYSVMDLGDLNQVSYRRDTDNPKKQNLPLVLDVLGQVRESVKLAIANRAWPLILGGDCSITIGVIAAMIKHFPDLGLSYIDGDVDLNTPETTNTGIFDGMVLAHILGQGADELRQFGTRCPLLEEQQIALFGYSVQAGGIDPAEIDILRNTQMAKFPLEDIDADVQTAAIQALQELESKSDHILVHFDVDVVDYDDFPAVDVPHKPGLALAQAQEALGVFVGSRKSVGLVVTE